MEETVREVLYETRHHASRPYASKYPPQPSQTNEGGKGGFLSLLSARGISQLRGKLSDYSRPKQIKRRISLFISPRGEHVAVAAGNRITILRKEDDYQEPCGVFIGGNLRTYTQGAWSESHDILGVVDETDTIYFIRANGEEITTIRKKHLKVSLPIIGLISQDDNEVKRSYLCSFLVLTSDGFFHHIEMSQEPSASISSTQTSNTAKRQFPQNVICFDYYPELSLLVVVSSAASTLLSSYGNSGSCCLSIWRMDQNLDLDSIASVQFGGLYCVPKGYVGLLACPKVLFSSQGNHIATLDLTGCLHIFKLDKECCSLSSFGCGVRSDLQGTNNLSKGDMEFLSDIVDFTWWSDCIITLAKSSGSVTMLDIISGLKLQDNDPVYSVPVLERVQQFPGQVFLVESISSEGRHSLSDRNREKSGSHHVGQITEDTFNQMDTSQLHWSLISFSKRSVSEMYNILISSQKYQAALDFANCHGLDGDEVLKSQWLHSDLGINEINKFLANIKDQVFVVSECMDKVGPTEDAMKALLAYGLYLTNQYGFYELEDDKRNQVWDFRMARLQILQFRDRLETFLGINMGRFSVQEYHKFRVTPINDAAVTLAESGKIGALNLLFKRHPYSLTSSMLQVLAAIPETVPVQTYGQLLPGRSPPTSIVTREEDWVECDKMVDYINSLPENHGIGIQIRTEPIIKRCLGSFWPPANEISIWYKDRARDIDCYSGQLDNCLCLVDYACRKGIYELQHFHEDINYLHQLIYSDKSDSEISLSLCEWEQLSDYEKFRTMLQGVKEENVVEKLNGRAIPFMKKRCCGTSSVTQDQTTADHFSVNHNADSFLVRWLKEMALENKLEICLMVFEAGCREVQCNGFFRDEVEAVDCALHCIYLCSVTDKWSTMASILSKLPQRQDTEICTESLGERLKLAEGHIESGRLLAYYQVPKPINFFIEAHADGKGVKQILRLILSKFVRRQPGRSDNDWANMWRDLLTLQEKAFPFLDLQYMLMEFCRGLLKAGKFSLARNYLKGTSSVALASEKAENLVIQAAREYLFSASSLACSEIWKAKECLNLFPSSANVKAEADMIDAITVKLPNLGVTLLPMQFRQIKDPMEIIKMAITSQAGTYLNANELFDVAKLLGLSSSEDISAVEEAIAREAAVAGDLQSAFDHCRNLAEKGYGLIWDLCAAIARGPALEDMDISSRKQLLGFALSHCDEESIGELLHAWKDLDMQETLMRLSGMNPPNLFVEGSSVISLPFSNIQDTVDLKDCSGLFEGVSNHEQEAHFNNVKGMLSVVAKNLPVESGADWESLLMENGKILSFASSQLPWLIELSRKAEHGKKLISGFIPGKCYVSERMQAIITILSWLARNGFAPADNLIASLVKSIIEPPVTEEEDVMGCSFLLNLTDAFNGVEVIEEQLRRRENYQEICSIMNVGMIYSILHNSAFECEGPAQRRELLLRKFKEKHTPLSSGEKSNIDKVQSTFWREWKLKLEEKKRVADHSMVLEQIIPGVETARFLSGDLEYIETAVFSLIESVKLEKKHILKDILKLANTYGLSRTELPLCSPLSLLVSELRTDTATMAEISEFKGEIFGCAPETIKILSLVVYPAVDGRNKQRLAYLYGLLSDCYLELEETKKELPLVHLGLSGVSTLKPAHFYKILEQELKRVSFIKNLNFKNIAGLDGLNLECFSSEVYTHIDEFSLDALAKMVQTLVSLYNDLVPKGLITWQDVYKHYVLSLLTAKARTDFDVKDPERFQHFITQLEKSYNDSRMYIRLLASSDAFEVMKQYFSVSVPLHDSSVSIPDNSEWQDCLLSLMNFWIRLMEEMQEIASTSVDNVRFNPECLMGCLKVFMRLMTEDSVSPSQGWGSIIYYINYGFISGSAVESLTFCRAMIFSGCGFAAISEVFYEAMSQCCTDSTLTTDTESQDLPHLYLNVLEPILENLVSGFHEKQNLYCLVSSISKLEGDIEDLKRIRHIVWEQMAKFSHNLQLPNDVRVYALEMMQCISGRNIKGFSAELQSSVLPWEGWDELLSASKTSESTANLGLPDHADTSSMFTSTLVALRSSQLVAAISPSMEITANDLLKVETAVPCFLKLCQASSGDPHFDALIAILEEWEGYFVNGRDEGFSGEISYAGNNWNDWDEGWETFQEPPEIHPLHECWLEICKIFASLSRFRDLLKLIDKSLSKSYGILLDEKDALKLNETLLEMDPFVALKVMLLLPYEAIQIKCLEEVENKLKQGGISDMIGRDHDILMLVLSSGILPTIITGSSYSTTFSYLCYLVGSLSHQCQKSQLARLTLKARNESRNSERDFIILFKSITLPCFISELVKADIHIVAGFLVSKFMHTNASLSLINGAEAILSRYLEQQLHVPHCDEFASEEILKGTISRLRTKLVNLIRSALTLLSTNQKLALV